MGNANIVIPMLLQLFQVKFYLDVITVFCEHFYSAAFIFGYAPIGQEHQPAMYQRVIPATIPLLDSIKLNIKADLVKHVLSTADEVRVSAIF